MTATRPGDLLRCKSHVLCAGVFSCVNDVHVILGELNAGDIVLVLASDVHYYTRSTYHLALTRAGVGYVYEGFVEHATDPLIIHEKSIRGA